MVQMHWQVQPSFLEGHFPGSGLCWARPAVEGGTLPPSRLSTAPQLASGSALTAALASVLWF